MQKVIQSPFKPRPFQLDLIHSTARFNVIVVHRRGGKTVGAINHMIFKLLQCDKKNPQGMFIAPEKAQARDVAERYLIEYTDWIPGASYSRSEMCATFPTPNGSEAKIFIRGADRPDQLRGMYYDHVVFDEVAQMPTEVWTEVILPALADRQGSAVFIGTPKGRNLFYELYEKGQSGDPLWFSEVYPVSKTRILPETELKMLRDTMGEEGFLQEFECSWDSTFKGSFYGKVLQNIQNAGSITTLPHNPHYKVITAWDLGYQDETVIWFAQKIGDSFHIIDYYSSKGHLIEHYINIVMAKPYLYKEHILPHDAFRNGLNSDLSITEKLKNAGLIIRRADSMPVIQGINITRNFLVNCKFDRTRCQVGIDHLASYQAKEDPTLGVLEQKPVDGIHSHAADSMRYLAISLRQKTHNEEAWVASPKLHSQQLATNHYDYDPFA